MPIQLLKGLIAKAAGSTVAVDATSVNGDGVLSTVSGTGAAIHGVIPSGGSASGIVGWFQQNDTANGSTGVVVAQAGTGNGLSVSNSASSNNTPSLVANHFGSGSGASGILSMSSNGTGVIGKSSTTSQTGVAGVTGTDNAASNNLADGVYGQVGGLGAAVHGKVTGTGATGKAGYFEQNTAANSADAVTINQAGTGKGLNVSTSLSTNSADGLTVAHGGTGKGLNVTTSLTSNSSATALLTQAGTGKILDLVGSLTTAVANAINVVVAGITGHGLFVSMTSAGATGDAVLAQNSGTGAALHGKALSTGRALYAEGISTITGLLTASAGVTLANSKRASSVVMLATPQRVINGVTLAATTYTYFAMEGSYTTNGQTVSIPSDALAVIGQFITVPNASSGANTFLSAYAANDSYTGTPGTTAAGISATGGAFQYSGATLPLGPGGPSSKQGVKLYASSSCVVYFDVYGYITN